MVTCNDCYHVEICDMPTITDGRKNASNCKKFKNKADIVEVRHGEWRKPLGDNGTGWNSRKLAIKLKHILAQNPDADVEEVVRCKDCKHLKTNISNELYCKVWGDKCGDYCDFDADTEPDNYCGYGERKETT